MNQIQQQIIRRYELLKAEIDRQAASTVFINSEGQEVIRVFLGDGGHVDIIDDIPKNLP